jgi:hypothetical protein
VDGVISLIGRTTIERMARANALFPQLSVESNVILSPSNEDLMVAAQVTTPRGMFNGWAGVSSFEDLSHAVRAAQDEAIGQALLLSLVGVDYSPEEAEPSTEEEDDPDGVRGASAESAPIVELGSSGTAVCHACGTKFGDYVTATKSRTLYQIVAAGQERFGKTLCIPCYRLSAQEQETDEPEAAPAERDDLAPKKRQRRKKD